MKILDFTEIQLDCRSKIFFFFFVATQMDVRET